MDQRRHVSFHRSLSLGRLVLPIVSVLLLAGATFVALAWDGARDATTELARVDEARANRNSRSVQTVVQIRWEDLTAWARMHRSDIEPGKREQLQRDLDKVVGDGGSSSALAWLVIDENDAVSAIGEQEPGRLAANGVLDDLRVVGRLAIERGKPQVSGRLRFGDRTVIAYAVPFPGEQTTNGGVRAALVSAIFVDRSALGAFVPPTASGDVGAFALLDARGRMITGSEPEEGEVTVTRPVGGTGWSMVLHRPPTPSGVLPTWTYPGFALLLAAVAIFYAIQARVQRRLRAVNIVRDRQLHTLYELASNVLHARTVRDQAEQLATAAMDLVEIDGARVRIAAERDAAGIVSGVAAASQREYHVAITGPREPVGELVVYRTGSELNDEERQVVRTAATLVGAAMHTIESLEYERAAGAELQRLDELRSNLLATVAHELRSPVTAVKGVLGLLSMQDDLPDRSREYVAVATERTDRLVALIQDLFDCSLLETGQLDIRPQRQQADGLLDSALGAQAAANPGELVLSATANLAITVDPVRFDQLVNNLVTNAFRHGSPPIEVAVRPWTNGAMVIVSDEGPGIPEEDRDRIFGKFWQGSSGHARLVEGAGLGLSLVQGLVALHGGHIEIDSVHADGRGARFTAYFPDVVPDIAMDERPGRRRAEDDPELAPITRII